MPMPHKMERLRDLASRPRRSGPFPFPFPVSLSRRNLFENTPKENNDDNDESLAQPSTADVHSGLTVSPSSQIGVSTQPVSNRTHHLGNEHSMGDNLETCRENKAKARQEARALQRETEQRLLAMADILTAHSDILTDSGLVLSRRLNELARDIFEANQIIARREREIAELTQQLGAMELRFNEVHVGLFKVSALVGEIIDGGIAQIHRNRTQATMEQALQGIRVVMGDEDVGEWEVGKVDGILAVCNFACPAFIRSLVLLPSPVTTMPEADHLPRRNWTASTKRTRVSTSPKPSIKALPFSPSDSEMSTSTQPSITSLPSILTTVLRCRSTARMPTPQHSRRRRATQ